MNEKLKYKVGDEVIVHLELDDEEEYGYIGQIGVIEKIFDDATYPFNVIFENDFEREFCEKEISLNTEEDIERFYLYRFANV